MIVTAFPLPLVIALEGNLIKLNTLRDQIQYYNLLFANMEPLLESFIITTCQNKDWRSCKIQAIPGQIKVMFSLTRNGNQKDVFWQLKELVEMHIQQVSNGQINQLNWLWEDNPPCEPIHSTISPLFIFKRQQEYLSNITNSRNHVNVDLVEAIASEALPQTVGKIKEYLNKQRQKNGGPIIRRRANRED
eukprot:TRINITY_DN5561_c0_g1_i2.p1 TRINITY_DN5561_c0_g1~~TRINITY_DN5561_c0_g1_i2.p1  ORF type:complete len:190 (+),score=6.06 TRINITY_DN5561_c0_g1_i2:167-736(+)